jgi:hypothetical protein
MNFPDFEIKGKHEPMTFGVAASTKTLPVLPGLRGPKETALPLERIVVMPDDAAHLADIKSVKSVAIIVNDVQKECADPAAKRGTSETRRIAREIASIIPEFAAAGAKVVVVVIDQELDAKAGVKELYEVDYDPAQHHLAVKNTNSAMRSGNFLSVLNELDVDAAIGMGFHARSCMSELATDFQRAGGKFFVASDLIGEGLDIFGQPAKPEIIQQRIDEMHKEGVKFVKGQEALAHLKKLKDSP